MKKYFEIKFFEFFWGWFFLEKNFFSSKKKICFKSFLRRETRDLDFIGAGKDSIFFSLLTVEVKNKNRVSPSHVSLSYL